MVRDAIEKGGLNLVGISRRIRVHLRRGGATRDAAFWGLLTVYELGYLPLRNVVTLRALANALGALAWAGRLRPGLPVSRPLPRAHHRVENPRERRAPA